MRWNKQTRTLEFNLIHHPISPPGSSVTTQTEVSQESLVYTPISHRGSWDIKAPIAASKVAVSRQDPAARVAPCRWELIRTLITWTWPHGPVLGVGRVEMTSGDVISLEKEFETLVSFHATVLCNFWPPQKNFFCLQVCMTCSNRLTEV